MRGRESTKLKGKSSTRKRKPKPVPWTPWDKTIKVIWVKCLYGLRFGLRLFRVFRR